MFNKAYRYDEGVLFYFDEHNCKYVAQGGSIAWRTHNPGLIASRHSIAKLHCSIGTHHQFAIFPSAHQGLAALDAWLNIAKYHLSLSQIARYYQKYFSQNCLEKLSALADIPKDIDLKTLSLEGLGKLRKAIQQLTGYDSKLQGTLTLLPKITAHYHSAGGDFELYITGYEEFISKQEAVLRVENHELDAVIVHKIDGSIHLRSRPGHHLNRIHFSDRELSRQHEFKEAIRDEGEHREGQCIWGFINGIDNKPSQAKQAIQVISSLAMGERVWSLNNDKKLFLSLGNIWDAALQKMNIETEVVKFAALFFRFLLDLANNDLSHPPVIIFVHSQGAIIGKAALRLLTTKEQQQLRIFTFGGGDFIFPENSHHESHNFISIGDVVPRLVANMTLALLAIRLHEDRKRGFTDDQILDCLIEEEIESTLSTSDLQEINLYRLQRRNHYISELVKVTHITVLDKSSQSLWEHSIHISCYQKKLKEIVEHYRNLRELTNHFFENIHDQ